MPSGIFICVALPAGGELKNVLILGKGTLTIKKNLEAGKI